MIDEISQHIIGTERDINYMEERPVVIPPAAPEEPEEPETEPDLAEASAWVFKNHVERILSILDTPYGKVIFAGHVIEEVKHEVREHMDLISVKVEIHPNYPEHRGIIWSLFAAHLSAISGTLSYVDTLEG